MDGLEKWYAREEYINLLRLILDGLVSTAHVKRFVKMFPSAVEMIKELSKMTNELGNIAKPISQKET